MMANDNDEKDIKETKEAIKKAQENLEQISKDEHERYLAELREKYIRDQVAVQEYGYIHGKEEGKEEGIKNIIKKMREKKLSDKEIMELTGLTEEEINNLK